MRARRIWLALALVGPAAMLAFGAAPVPTAGGLAPAARLDGAAIDALAADGERWWTTSPDPANPVACATCHYDAAKTRGWAASFPKFRPLPPPHARVMTLLQATAEAVRLHYRLADPRPAATAITAYLTVHGAGIPPSPGVIDGQPVFPARLRALASSVTRGGRLYASRCASCHDPDAVSRAAANFPRVREGRGESLEDVLERHAFPGEPLAWDSQAMADVVAYLATERSRRIDKGEP